MTVVLDRARMDVAPGAVAALGYTVTNEVAAAVRFGFGVEGDHLNAEWVQLDAPGVVEAGGQARGTLWVRVPRGAAPGKYRLRLVAVDPLTGGQSVAECAVTVADDSAGACVMFPETPSFRLDSDGLTASVTVANCGGLDVNVTLRFRHEGGWRFGVEREVALETGFGPVTVTVPLDRSGETGAGLQDRITVEADWQGHVLVAESAAVTAPRPRPHRSQRSLGRAAAVGVVVLGLAGSLWGDDVVGGNAPPGIEVTAQETPDEGDEGQVGTPVVGPDGGDERPVGELVVDPDEVDFGQVAPGRSQTAEVGLRNGGGAPVAVDALSVRGDTAAFAVDEDACSAITLQSEERCQMTVTFAPTRPGDHQAQLTIDADAAGRHTVHLIGQGVVDEPPTVTIVSPPAETFPTSMGERIELELSARIHDDHDEAIRDVDWAATWTTEDGRQGRVPIGSGNNVRRSFQSQHSSCDNETTYTLTASALDSAGNTAEDRVQFTLRTACPVVE